MKLISSPILGYPYFSLEFILHLDASNFALSQYLIVRMTLNMISYFTR